MSSFKVEGEPGHEKGGIVTPRGGTQKQQVHDDKIEGMAFSIIAMIEAICALRVCCHNGSDLNSYC